MADAPDRAGAPAARPRVGLDVRPALFGVTGVGRAARQLARALADRGRVELVPYGAAWTRARPGLELPGVRAPRLPGRLQQLLAPLGFGVEAVTGPLDAWVHTDVVYAPVRRAPQLALVHDVLFLREEAWHGADFRATVGARVRRRLPGMAAVLVPCQRTADDLLAHGLVPAERIVVAPLGCDHVDPGPRTDDARRVAALLERAGLPRREGELLVLAPGTREPRKNQARLVAAFLSLPPATPARLLLAGPPGWGCPDLERDLARLAARPRDERRVAAAGELDEADLGALLRTADLVAYPSLAEGFGLPVFEALRCGRPVLTARDTPMADLAGAAVALADPRDQADLARTLAALLADPDRRRELGRAGPAAVAGLTWASHAERLESVVWDLLS